MTTSLELGCDCLGEITYVDAVLHDSAGEPTVIRNAICLHEEDDGVAWKHVDGLLGAEVRRRRRMVVSFHTTVANYEYLVYWRFYEDGTIECEVRATGIMVTTPFPEGADAPPYGTVVDTRTYAPIHQHFLVARLDLDVDGEPNTVVMTETVQLPVGPDNPYGLALAQAGVPLTTEGGFDPNWATQRAWKVQSSTRRNAHGAPTAYKLVPSGAFPAMIDPSSPVFERAQVIGHTLWVTPFHADERWPCGEFVNQSASDEGLAVWTQAQRPIGDTDVVLWYVFGIHHVPRVEDWPVMPVDVVSFRLAPTGFFDRNPALDVAPEPGHGGVVARRRPRPRLLMAATGRSSAPTSRSSGCRAAPGTSRRPTPRRTSSSWVRRSTAHLAPARHPVRAAAHPPDLLPASRRVAPVAGVARRRAAGRPDRVRRGRRRDVLRRRGAVGARPAARRAHRHCERRDPARARRRSHDRDG